MDDDADVRETFAEVLRREGHLVTAAADGMEGLTALEEDELPSVIVLDVMMPRIDGWEFRRRQLASRAAVVPTIFLTAAPREGGRAADLGCVFMSKPFDVLEFLALVRKAGGR